MGNEPVAVVGANGFIGRNLVRALHADGRRVIAVDKGWDDDDALVAQVCASDTIYWCAGSINPALAEKNPLLVQLDIDMFTWMLDQLDASGSRARLVNFSSGGTIYGNGEPPFDEARPRVPISAYGKAKVEMERLLAGRPGRGVSVRIANPYGPGQYPAPGQGVISHWLFSLAGGTPIEVLGGLDAKRDYIYIDDLTAALVALGRVPEVPLALNLGSGRGTPLGEVLAAVEAACHAANPQIITKGARNFDVRDTHLDITVAKALLGWAPRVQLEDGIASTWQWVQKHAHGSSGQAGKEEAQ